jgi:hypothetical protein
LFILNHYHLKNNDIACPAIPRTKIIVGFCDYFFMFLPMWGMGFGERLVALLGKRRRGVVK